MVVFLGGRYGVREAAGAHFGAQCSALVAGEGFSGVGK
jgi:hypothetical protein